MVQKSNVWIRVLPVFAIFTIGFISIDNRIVFSAQQQQIQNLMVKLDRIIKTQNLKTINVKLEKLTTQQKQIKQQSLQQEKIIALLKQEEGITTSLEDINVEDKILLEQHTQQEQEKEQGRIDQMMSNLESFWQNDQVNSGQSPINETSLIESFSQVDDETDIINVGCKSNICKIELEQTMEGMLAGNNQFDEILTDSTIFSESFPNDDGSQRVVMYVTQGQVELTEIFE